MPNLSANYWIELFKLTAHVEGGWYSEVYRSPIEFLQEQLPQQFFGSRQAATHIYFLLEQGQFSAFHRIKSDELWHFYSGEPLIIYEIYKDGSLKEHLLGNDPTLNQTPFTVITAGNWFASRPAAGSSYSLVGCTVSPGFDFADLEMADRKLLTREFPELAGIIRELSLEVND